MPCSARAPPGDRGHHGSRVDKELEGSVALLAERTLDAAEAEHVSEANRDLLARRPGAAVKMPEHDEAVTVADELLGLGVRVLEELGDVVEVLERVPRAAVGPALRQGLGEDERGVGREVVQKRWIAVLEESVTLADV